MNEKKLKECVIFLHILLCKNKKTMYSKYVKKKNHNHIIEIIKTKMQQQ